MRPLKTYIVEDSRVIREDLIATLEELGPVEVVGTAEDESTAVRWLTQPSSEFDLVIIALQQRRNLVVLSNYATQDIRHRCLALGADRVFDKSNEIEALITYCGRLAAGETGRREDARWTS
jgi:DNA-binding NarL/FixJ family response regulator